VWLGKKPSELPGNGDGVSVSYGGVRGMVVAIRVRVCSTIIPGSIWGSNQGLA
jgi:hypothetical protein